MFAGDLFFFGENTWVNINNLKKILKRYFDLLGKLINYKKNLIFSKGISSLRKKVTIQKLGVKEMNENDNHLGIYPLQPDYKIFKLQDSSF